MGSSVGEGFFVVCWYGMKIGALCELDGLCQHGFSLEIKKAGFVSGLSFARLGYVHLGCLFLRLPRNLWIY